MKKVLILSVLGLVCLLWTNTKISQKDLDQLIALENIEAIASGEGTAVSTCYTNGFSEGGEITWYLQCDSDTYTEMIYPCPGADTFGTPGKSSMCTK